MNGKKNFNLETITYHDKSKRHREAVTIQLNTVDKPEDAPTSHAKNQLTRATSDKLGLLYGYVHALFKHQKSFRNFSWQQMMWWLRR